MDFISLLVVGPLSLAPSENCIISMSYIITDTYIDLRFVKNLLDQIFGPKILRTFTQKNSVNALSSIILVAFLLEFIPSV